MAPVIQEQFGVQQKEPDKAAKFNPYGKIEVNQIRLAEIKAASSLDEDVVCSLRVVLRDDAPPYRALSYCWGPREHFGLGRVFFEVGNQKKGWAVTPNLELALRRLRSNDLGPSLLIWVDALCINQGNDEEKGEQVAKMRLIYEEAFEVLVWLGDEDNNSLLAWDLMEGLMKHHETLGAVEKFVASWKEKDFTAILALFRREYFRRIWVVQEINCAKKAEAHCGSKSIPWLDFLEIGSIMGKVKKAFQETAYHNRPAAKFSLMTGGPRNLIVHQMKGTSPQAPPLLDMLSSHARISADRDTFGKIDYKRSPRATYVYTSCYLINTTRKLNVICLKQNDDDCYNLPSWVADWERRNLHPSHRVMGLQIREPPFTASGKEYTDASFAEDGEILVASGFVLDTITVAAQPLYVDGPESEASQTLKIFHNWWIVFTNNIGHGLKQIEAFQRTFCGGEWAPKYSDFEEHRVSLFFSLMKKLLPGLLKGLPVPIFEPDESITAQDEYALVSSAALRMHAKRFIVSATKLVGLAPQDTKEGDKIVVLLGCDFPVVMRNMGDYWILIGEIYVDGMMYGEAMSGFQSGQYTKSKFFIR